jgi:diacylglycerol O-acyltransferase-1
MATLTQASSTGLNTYDANSTKQRGCSTEQNGSDSKQTNGSVQRKKGKDSKYRHVFATHSETRITCLSHESESMPSFVGFRNLMILVLSMLKPPQGQDSH